MAGAIVRSRRAVLVGLLAAGAALGAAAPGVQVRFDPEELVAPDERPRADDDLIDHDEPIVVVFEADDVLAVSVLRYIHTLARTFAREPAVVAIEGPTTTPLPLVEAPPEGAAETLDDLADDDLGATPLLDPTMVALGTIVATDPGRWPLGMLSFANEARRIRVAPLVPAEATPSAADAHALADLVASSSLVGGRLVSRDRRVSVMALRLAPDSGRDEVDRLIVRTREAIAAPPEGVRASLSGLPAIRLEMVDALRADQIRLVLLAFALSFLVLLLGMRSVVGVLLPLGTVGITVAMTLGAMSLAGEPLNLLTNMIPPLLVTIGLAEAVHMILRWEEFTREGGDRTRSAVRALEAMALPCLVTTGTTAIGFGALLLQETEILRHFGLVAAIASMLVYGVTVLFVPAALPSFTPRSEPAGRVGDRLLERSLVAIARVTARHPGVTIASSAAIFLAALAVARGVTIDSTLMDQFARGSEVARTTAVLEGHLDGVRSLDVVLEATPGTFAAPEGIATLAEIVAWLRAQPGVLRATSFADWLLEARRVVHGDVAVNEAPLHSEDEIDALRALLVSRAGAVPHDPTARFVSLDGARARIEVRLADRGASRILAMLDELSVEVARTPGLEVRCSGEAFLASRGLDRIVRSLGSLGAAVVVIFLVMTLLFRSVRLGLLSVPPNALPLALTVAYMAVRGIPLNAATVIVFTVSIGLAVDGATHVIARFREEAADQNTDSMELVRRTIVSSGRGVVLAAATLLLGYGALLLSAFEPVRVFGELSAVAIAGSLVAQVVLLPALLAATAKSTR